MTKRQAPTREMVAMAEKMGFDAYGMTRDMPDPVSKAIGSMLHHIHVQDSRIEQLCKALRSS